MNFEKWPQVGVVGCLLLCGAGGDLMARTYTTNFPLTENPVSEGGNWIGGATTGLDWRDVMTTNNTAIGTETSLSEYDDSTAILTGVWGSNQTVTATVYVTNQPNSASGIFEELELRLRSSLSAHSCTGYEINFSARSDTSAYSQIVRWNGPLGKFTLINGNSGSGYILHSGDTVRATITNSTITVFINGIYMYQGTDTNYLSGNPGMGFYLYGTNGLNGDYGFTSYTATDNIPPPPTLITTLTNGQFGFSFQTVAGQSYSVQQTADLAGTNWVTLTNFTGAGILFQFTVPVTNTQSGLFFRVREP